MLSVLKSLNLPPLSARRRVRMPTRFLRPARFVSLAALPLVFAAALPVADGMSYEFIMKNQSSQTGNKETVTLRGRGTYSGDDARIEILDASANTGGTEMFGGKGAYFVVRNGGLVTFTAISSDGLNMSTGIACICAVISALTYIAGGLLHA